ncbi:hypothetical protein LTR42_001073 [Elasticomyces elasticus]|nr:hypothetical protein LTR42_001073 [Elasticomyces elasticus]
MKRFSVRSFETVLLLQYFHKLRQRDRSMKTNYFLPNGGPVYLFAPRHLEEPRQVQSKIYPVQVLANVAELNSQRRLRQLEFTEMQRNSVKVTESPPPLPAQYHTAEKIK